MVTCTPKSKVVSLLLIRSIRANARSILVRSYPQIPPINRTGQLSVHVVVCVCYYRGGGAGGAGGAIAPPNIEVGGLSPPLRYHQVMNNYNLIAISVLSVAVCLNRVSLASQTYFVIDDRLQWTGDQDKYWFPGHCNRSSITK